jgi:hypothetical protein
VSGGDRVDQRDRCLDGPAGARPACLAVARVHEESSQPRLEAVGVAEGGDVAPGQDERLLGRVVGPVAIGQDQPGDAEELVDREARKLAERLVIARHRPLDQVPPHRVLVLVQ